MRLRRPLWQGRRRKKEPDSTSKPVSIAPGMSMVNTDFAPVAKGPRQLVSRKLVLTVALAVAVASTVVTGTFASYTALTQNSASTFATGSIVLSDKVDSGTSCFSTGAGTNTDTNSNTNCTVMFDATNNSDDSSKRPGEYATAQITLKNEGNLSGNLSVMSQADCSVSDPVDQPIAGTANTATSCGTVQLSIEDGSTCYYGDNVGTSSTKPYIQGADLTYPIVVAVANTASAFKMVVDGVTRDNLSIAAGTYTTATAFAAAVQTAATPYATVTNTSGGALKFQSLTAAPTSKISLGIPTSNPDYTALATPMGFIDGSAASKPGVCATASGSSDDSLSDFRVATTSTPLSLGTLASGQSRVFTVTLSVPAAIYNDQLQGRTVGFELTWVLRS